MPFFIFCLKSPLAPSNKLRFYIYKNKNIWYNDYVYPIEVLK